jgi:glycine/D-amino acid oxidase-like deaminating enzyme
VVLVAVQQGEPPGQAAEEAPVAGRPPDHRPQRVLGVQLAVELPEVEEDGRVQRRLLLRFVDPPAEPVLPGAVALRGLRAPAEALRLEPGLTPAPKAAVWVPDATMDAMRLLLRFFASARRNGADLRPFTEATGLLRHGALVTGVAVHEHLTGRDAEIQADLVVNAAGPWCERIVERVLRGLAAVTVVYGLWLLATIALRG